MFDAVLTEGSISRAAEKIGVSQPAVSLAISRFRQVVGDDLFESTGRGVKPTPRALQLAGPVRRAMDLVSGALDQDTGFDIGRTERTFNLVLGDFGELVLLPRLMGFLGENGSPVRVNTLAAGDLDLAREMRFGNVDLYGWMTPFDNKDFVSHQMGSFREVCLVRENHPEVRDKPSLELFAALKHIVIQLPDDHGPSGVDRELWAHGLTREHTMVVHTYFDVPAILSATDMICSMPLQLARHFSEMFPVKIVPSPIEVELASYLIWHKTSDNDPGHRWLREYLIDLSSRT